MQHGRLSREVQMHSAADHLAKANQIESMLGISKETIEDHVKYEREIAKAFEKVDSGEFQLVFLMNPTKPDQVKSVAELGERMPQKSTDFYPKLVSGLVLFDIAEDETIG